MYIFWALCQAGRSQSIELGSFVYIPGPLSNGKVSKYSNKVLCIYPRSLCQVGKSQSKVLVSYTYIQCHMSGGKAPTYSTGILCIYHRPYVGCEGFRV